MKEVTDEVMNTMAMTAVDATIFDAYLTHWSKNITAPSTDEYPYYNLVFSRQVSADDIMNNMDLDMMPGFRFTWNYNKYVEPENIYSTYGSEEPSKQFVR